MPPSGIIQLMSDNTMSVPSFYKSSYLTREDGQLDVSEDFVVGNSIGLFLIRVDSLLGNKLNPFNTNIKIGVALIHAT
jgi:hypothetical protein